MTKIDRIESQYKFRNAWRYRVSAAGHSFWCRDKHMTGDRAALTASGEKLLAKAIEERRVRKQLETTTAGLTIGHNRV